MNEMILFIIMENIESSDFNFKANLASGSNVFKRILKNQYSFTSLVDLLRSDDKTHDMVIQRVKEVSELEIDLAYANRYDTALAAYLYALALVNPEWGKELIPTVIKAKNLFWALKIMREMQDGFAA